jgi:hypothetical protein
MTIRKDEVLKLVGQFPDEVDIEELIYRLYLLEKLAAAEADIEAGRAISAEEMRAQVKSWRP